MPHPILPTCAGVHFWAMCWARAQCTEIAPMGSRSSQLDQAIPSKCRRCGGEITVTYANILVSSHLAHDYWQDLPQILASSISLVKRHRQGLNLSLWWLDCSFTAPQFTRNSLARLTKRRTEKWKIGNNRIISYQRRSRPLCILCCPNKKGMLSLVSWINSALCYPSRSDFFLQFFSF